MNAQHQAYLALLAKWNATVNLTALTVDPPDAAAIERLILEPVRAARFILPEDELAVDLGSGGGSPALPLKIECPWLRFVLVESKTKKCAFLREAVRTMGLTDVKVEQARFEDLSLPVLADIVTFRAVRSDAQLWNAAGRLLKVEGRALWFGGNGSGVPPGWRVSDQDAQTLLLVREGHA